MANHPYHFVGEVLLHPVYHFIVLVTHGTRMQELPCSIPGTDKSDFFWVSQSLQGEYRVVI